MKLRLSLIVPLLLLTLKIFAAESIEYSEKKDCFYKYSNVGGAEKLLDCAKFLHTPSHMIQRILTRDEVRENKYNFNCFLKVSYNRIAKPKDYYASGILISPHLILTAAHNLYDLEEKYPNRIDCFRGCVDNDAIGNVITVYPTSNPKSVFIHPKYIPSQSKKYEFSSSDIALITFNGAHYAIENWATPYLLTELPDEFFKKAIEDICFTITGYPEALKKPFTMKGKLVFHSTTREKICYEIHTERGQSGSGICFEIEGEEGEPKVYCAGVHVWKGDFGENFNIGVFIDAEFGGYIKEFNEGYIKEFNEKLQ